MFCFGWHQLYLARDTHCCCNLGRLTDFMHCCHVIINIPTGSYGTVRLCMWTQSSLHADTHRHRRTSFQVCVCVYGVSVNIFLYDWCQTAKRAATAQLSHKQQNPIRERNGNRNAPLCLRQSSCLYVCVHRFAVKRTPPVPDVSLVIKLVCVLC